MTVKAVEGTLDFFRWVEETKTIKQRKSRDQMASSTILAKSSWRRITSGKPSSESFLLGLCSPVFIFQPTLLSNRKARSLAALVTL